MAGDGIHDPLKTRRPPRGTKPSSWRGALALVLAGALAGLGLLVGRGGGGHGGEPFAVATIKRSPEVPADARPAQSEAAAPAMASMPVTPRPPSGASSPQSGQVPGQDVSIENGVRVVRGAGNVGHASTTLRIPQAGAVGLSPAPDPRLSEPSAFGPVPKIGTDGSRPADVYARHDDPVGNQPRIAILIEGVGFDRAEAARASAALPGPVTFGFAASGPDLEEQVRRARADGHEVVLQLPMEDSAQAEPAASHMLTAGQSGNQDRLHWLMSRFSGYAGVGNLGGARLLADEAALQPLLQELAARGLYFVDDGRAARSLAAALAADVGLPSIRADIVIDANPDKEFLNAALGRLESLARSGGFALGVAIAQPATDAAIGRFAAELGRRGVSLVSVSQALRAEPRVSVRSPVEQPGQQP